MMKLEISIIQEFNDCVSGAFAVFKGSGFAGVKIISS
jgi:hypothetical protein